jgi:hypothetical protein
MNYEWVKLYVQSRLEDVARDLGEEVGTSQKHEREEMHAHVCKIVDNLSKTIRSLTKASETQDKKIKALEAKLAEPRKEAETVDLYGPANGQTWSVIAGRCS